jgi:sugar lactone lactonase YvrE
MIIAARLLVLSILLCGALVVTPSAAQVVNTLGSGFNYPRQVAIDRSGNVFVADVSNNAVKEILAVGGYSTVKSLAVQNGNFGNPTGVAVDSSDNVFVVDYQHNAVKEILAPDYVTVKTIAETNGHFNGPASIAIDTAGDLFVADQGNHVVKEILAAGDYVTVNTLAPVNGQFVEPAYVAVDGSGNVFVDDLGDVNSPEFKFKEILASGGYTTVNTLPLVVPGFTAAPAGLAVDASDNLFVAGGNVIGKFTAADGYSTVLQLPYAAPKFQVATGVALDHSSNLFVADGAANTVSEIVLPPSPIVAAVLPGSRSVDIGTPTPVLATVFATMINTSNSDLAGCSAELGGMGYQTTDPATNALTGSPNQPVTIPAKGWQTFLLSFERTAEGKNRAPVFFCQNATPAPITLGVNTVDLTFAYGPVADIIALSATTTDDGTLHLSKGVGAFAVSTINAGTAESLTASVDTGMASLPLAISLCQTNAFGECLAPPAASLPINFTGNATATFSVFATSTGPIPFAPAGSRIFVRFQDGGGYSHGSTSVAVTTS